MKPKRNPTGRASPRPSPIYRFTGLDGKVRHARFYASKDDPGLYWDVSVDGRQETSGFAFYGPLGVRALFDHPHHHQDPTEIYGSEFTELLDARLRGAGHRVVRRNPTESEKLEVIDWLAAWAFA